MSRYFCARCRAQADEALAMCYACGLFSRYVPEVFLPPRQVLDVRQRTARALAYGRTPTREVYGLGALPTNSPALVAVYGEPGGGKSSFMLRIARALADQSIPSIYVSAEEGFGATIAQRLRLVELCSDDVVFVEACNSVSALAVAEERGARWLFLDSYSVSGWNVVDLVTMRGAGLSCIYALHVTKDGQAAGEMAIAHEADVIVHVAGGKWSHKKNRYGTLLNGEVFFSQPELKVAEEIIRKQVTECAVPLKPVNGGTP